jgi:hypothetical protein
VSVTHLISGKPLNERNQVLKSSTCRSTLQTTVQRISEEAEETVTTTQTRFQVKSFRRRLYESPLSTPVVAVAESSFATTNEADEYHNLSRQVQNGVGRAAPPDRRIWLGHPAESALHALHNDAILKQCS